jgi:hypothetical protein
MAEDRLFTVPEVKAVLTRLRAPLAEFVSLRADASELAEALQSGSTTSLGGRAELKAAEARLDELLSMMVAAGAELKGVAPLLLDFPGELDGGPVMFCWLEGDEDLSWYHRSDLGFVARRRLPG